jgi:hypothetical protein
MCFFWPNLRFWPIFGFDHHASFGQWAFFFYQPILRMEQTLKPVNYVFSNLRVGSSFGVCACWLSEGLAHGGLGALTLSLGPHCGSAGFYHCAIL